MAKLEKLSEQMSEKVFRVVKDFQISQIATVEAMCAIKQKQPVVVSRANAATEFLTNKPETVLIFVNEPIMEKLSDEQQDMIIRDALSGVYLNSDNGKLVVNKPDISISMWGHTKYGENLTKAMETFVLAAQQAEEEEKEKKAAKKQKKSEE